jgi:DNA-binding beta-propeller fold protein YncE
MTQSVFYSFLIGPFPFSQDNSIMRYFFPSNIPQVIISSVQATTSGIQDPRGIVVDLLGRVYIANAGRNTISRLTFNNGTVGWNATTLYINVNNQFSQPGPMVFGSDGR